MRRRNLALLATLALLAAVLAGTVDERPLGAVADQQAMLETSVAIAETGDAGIARGLVFAVHRGAEDVSPYGIGLPLVLVPACRAAAAFEKAHGPGASQVLLAATQIAVLLGAALAAALLARALGASAFAERLAAAGAVLASPLWAYAASLYSEPLQALLLTAALALATSAAKPSAAAPRAGPALALAAGVAAGLAVLVKPLNLVAVPFALAPLLPPGIAELRARARPLLAAAAGAAVGLAAWAGSEVARFGRPLSSYGDQRFTHFPLDGVWRLLVGPNKGLLLYFPLALLAAAGVARLARARETRTAALGIAGVFGALLLVSSAWWAWDGTVGWGPRLLLPAVPALSAVAGFAADASRRARGAAIALAACGLGVNALGVFQNEAVASAYLDSCGPVTLDDAAAGKLPASFLERGGAGLASPSLLAGSDAALSPLRLHAFLLRARFGASDRQQVAERIAIPPWAAAHPELRPRVVALGRVATTQTVLGNALTAPFAWPRLGAILDLGEEERSLNAYPAWKAALASQVYRNLDVGRVTVAEREARTLFGIQASGFHAALLAEALRVEGRGREALETIATLPPSALASPALVLVRALLARDAGDEAGARALMGQAARVVAAPAVLRAAAGPSSSWPTLHGLLSGR